MLPDGWRKMTFGELFEFKNGFNADKEKYGKGTKFINIMEVINKISLRYDDIPGQVELDNKSIELYSVRRGDILFNRTSETPDEVGLTSVYLDDRVVVFGGFVIRARPIDQTLDHNFCKYCFLSDRVRKEVVRRGQGAIRANIGQGDLSDVSILVPPLLEQQKIAKILSTWDEAIEKLERLAKEKQKRKIDLARLLLTGKFRFDKVGKAQGSAITKNKSLPEGWSRTSLFSVLEKIVGGGTPSKSNPLYWDRGTIPWVTVKDLKKNIIDDAEEYITDLGLKESSANLVKAGTVIVSTRMAVGKAVRATRDVAINQDLKALIPSNKIISEYLHFFIDFSKGYLESMGTGSTVKGIILDDLGNMQIDLPPIFEQQRVASILSKCDAEISILDSMKGEMIIQKQGLMQVLLTGKKRVKVT